MAELKEYEYKVPGSNISFTAQLDAETVKSYKDAGLEVSEVKAKTPANKAAGPAANK